MSGYAKTVMCTVDSGKNIIYLPTTVTLDTDVKTTKSGLTYISYKGLTFDGHF